MSDNPTVCVISAFYNRGHGVRNTLEALHAQTYENAEFLVWDDCSKDDTWEALQKVAQELDDPRLKIFRNDSNLGLSRGLNKAVCMTDATYIAVIGSGDSCHPDRIKLQVAALEADPSAVLCTAAVITTDINSRIEFRDTSFPRDTVQLSDMTFRCAVPHGAVMYRREDFLNLGGYAEELKWCADWDLFNRLLANGHGIYLQHILSYRIAQNDGVSFHPEKAFEQLVCKQLVIRLATLSPTERSVLLKRIEEEGALALVGNKHQLLERDLARRNTKLYLMGRRNEAIEMSKLAKSRKIAYPVSYIMALAVVRPFTAVFRNTYGLIALARKFIK